MSWNHGLMLVIGLWFVVYLVAEWIAWIDRRKPKRFRQRDRVAERKRAIVRNGFKTRAGIR